MAISRVEPLGPNSFQRVREGGGWSRAGSDSLINLLADHIVMDMIGDRLAWRGRSGCMVQLFIRRCR